MSTAGIILEYLRVLLAGPVVAGAVAITFMRMFRGGLSGLISRTASIKLPGGGELVAPQLPPEAEKASPPPPVVPDQQQPLLPASLDDSQLKAIKELFDAERARSYLWEYRYLNYFLVPITQEVLEWLNTAKQRVSVAMADTLWSSRIPDAGQRRTILAVLESHHLVQRDGDLIEISPKGREYLEWKTKI